jgi:very-short-patch-repair endonuclease
MRVRGPRPKQTRRSRDLRVNSTKVELLVWRHLRNRQLGGFKFVRQEPVAHYYVDFVCRERRLIVELDGGQHADSATDRRRDAHLAELGFRIIRVWNNEALQNIEGVMQMCCLSCGNSPSPTHPARGSPPLPVNGARV